MSQCWRRKPVSDWWESLVNHLKPAVWNQQSVLEVCPLSLTAIKERAKEAPLKDCRLFGKSIFGFHLHKGQRAFTWSGINCSTSPLTNSYVHKGGMRTERTFRHHYSAQYFMKWQSNDPPFVWEGSASHCRWFWSALTWNKHICSYERLHRVGAQKQNEPCVNEGC